MSEPTPVGGIPQLWTSAMQETRTQLDRNPLQLQAPEVDGHAAWMQKRPKPLNFEKLVGSPPFQYAVAVVLTFMLSFIALIAIQPPFTFTNEPENKHETKKFSATKASLYALGATVLGVVIVVALYIFSKQQNKVAVATK